MKMFRHYVTPLFLGICFMTCNPVFADGHNTYSDVTKEGLNKPQTKQVEAIIHRYLVDHPKVLIEALQSLQQYQVSQEQQKAVQVIKDNAQSIFFSHTSPVIGNKNGSVSVVEFLDYRCGHCREMGPIIAELIANNKNVKVIIKELPIFGKASRQLAKAALASAKQDRFTPFHKQLLSTKQSIRDIAKSTRTDFNQLQKDMKAQSIQEEIDNNLHIASEIGILGTPAFIVADHSLSHVVYIPGATSLEELTKIVDSVH